MSIPPNRDNLVQETSNKVLEVVKQALRIVLIESYSSEDRYFITRGKASDKNTFSFVFLSSSSSTSSSSSHPLFKHNKILKHNVCGVVYNV